ncbi:hypothetical protein WJ13_00105 [Burkholderia seminalis]|nr:hypothetical protein WJ13_00105 [Burkholderia seminalis]
MTGAAADRAGPERLAADRLPTLASIAHDTGRLGERLSAQLKEAAGRNVMSVRNAFGRTGKARVLKSEHG